MKRKLCGNSLIQSLLALVQRELGVLSTKFDTYNVRKAGCLSPIGISRLEKETSTPVSSVPLAERVVKAISFSLVPLVLLPPLAFAQYQFEVTPSISVGETYDDNLYLTHTNERSDYITTVSPGIKLDMLSEKGGLTLGYVPSFVWYADHSENNTVRHSANLAFHQQLAEHLKFDLTDRYLKSEEPLEVTEEISTVRRTRNTYQRNAGQAGMTYNFGPENSVAAGYRQYLLVNKDPTIDDRTIHTPFVDATYWFNIKHGMSLSYNYTKADFSRDEGTITQPDYTGHSPGVKYLHRFSPETLAYAGYTFTTRRFDSELRQDYDVHEGSVGLEKQFSAETSLSAAVGYFVQDRERSDNEDGYTYNLLLTRKFQRGTFTIGSKSGWEEQSLEPEDRGFVRYWSGNARLDYQFLEPLSGYAIASYRQDKDQVDVNRKTWRGNCGLKWAFHQYFSLALDYSYANRDSDKPLDDYDVNRVMLVLTGSKAYRW